MRTPAPAEVLAKFRQLQESAAAGPDAAVAPVGSTAVGGSQEGVAEATSQDDGRSARPVQLLSRA